MTMSRERISGILAAVVGVALVGAASTIVMRGSWLTPASELRADITAARDSLNRQKRALREADDVATFLDDFAARGLGVDRESVDHALRTRVTDIAESVGIPNAIVSTRGERVIATPMRSTFPRRGIWRQLRDQPDLVELSASVSGEASLGQALALLGSLRGAEWPHRIDGFRFDPRRGGERIGFRVDLTTAYLPDRDGGDSADRPTPGMPEDIKPAVARLAAANRFMLPVAEAPPTAVAQEPPPTPAGPPPFPWERWTLTGVADGPDGREAWLSRGDNGSARVLGPGDTFESLVLVSIDEDGVVLGAGDDRVRIVIGDTLAAAGRIK